MLTAGVEVSMAASTTITESRAHVSRNRLLRAGVAATLSALVAVALARGLVGVLYDLNPALDPFSSGEQYSEPRSWRVSVRRSSTASSTATRAARFETSSWSPVPCCS
jgi:hypothetical protein